MAANWGDFTWNEYGELVLDIYKQPPETKDDITNKPKHTYKEIDCGGECGGCVALVVDGEVVSGPPFHPNCKCSLSEEDIEGAPERESNLGNPVGPNRNSEPRDVKWLKDALNKLGFYEPDSRAGETPDDLNEYPNQNLFDGINKFQREHGLSERGTVKPGHQTEAKINRELQHQTKEPKADFEYNGSTFKGPINAKDEQYAVFDGKTLAVYDGGDKIAEFAGVSGKPGYQSPEYQNKKDTGPIPQGTYVARKKDFQNRDDYGPVKKYTSWPGGEHGWGKHRVWLEPSKETNTFGRDGFSIHGGEEPGSAGCIDLTSEMPGFADWFEKNGKDLIIKVEY
ncbi:MAG: DUF2778 domain-containing protein [Alphaproteobacteria bacterium]|nr:DUF2778 domain-containing protein [Alphaproteobacteria bacterium]